jgi:hypothetical protein
MKTYITSLFIMSFPVWIPIITPVHMAVVLFPSLAIATYLFAREASK